MLVGQTKILWTTAKDLRTYKYFKLYYILQQISRFNKNKLQVKNSKNSPNIHAKSIKTSTILQQQRSFLGLEQSSELNSAREAEPSV